MPIYLEYLGYSVEVPTGETVVGRDVTCALRFNDASVSRKHLRFTRDGDQVLVEDLHSTNGTLVNGQPISGRTRLGDGDVIELGSYSLELCIESPDEEEQSTRRIATLMELGNVGHPVKPSSLRQPTEAIRAMRATLQPSNRRRGDRLAIELQVVYMSDELEIEVTSRDLSISGVFVCSDVLDPVGTQCSLRVLIDGGPPLEIRGIVRRVVEKAGVEPVGLGIEFEQVGPNEKHWIENAVARLQAAGSR